MSSSSSSRPRTSKPRGICRYYASPRGCFAGNACKFLHSSAKAAAKDENALTPYDRAKKCVFYARGYCRRGDQCWFRHELDVKAAGDSDMCGICLEYPATFGLLEGCSHVFCIDCIRQWRTPGPTTCMESTDGSMNKKCPLCRTPSKFVIPSSHFYPSAPESSSSNMAASSSSAAAAAASPPTDPKNRAIEAYKASMKRIPCRRFLANKRRSCIFGNGCFYQHVDKDGKAVILEASSTSTRSRRLPNPFHILPSSLRTPAAWLNAFINEIDAGDQRGDVIDHGVARARLREDLEAVFDILGFAPGSGGPEEAEPGWGDDPAAQNAENGPLLNLNQFFDLMSVQEQYTDMYPNTPTLVAGLDDEEDDVPIGSQDDEVMPPLSPLPVRISSFELGEPPSDDEAFEIGGSLFLSDDEGDGMPVLAELSDSSVSDSEPPFVTDGRGRVVWSRGASSDSEDGCY